MLLSAVLNENLKEDLSKALEITWKGVLAIFIVIAIVIIAVSIMSVITKKIENAKQLKEQAKNAENNGGQN
ncbi:MAG: OadG family protein [Clostridia bacterium]|nr:OadG family protein [Clostridia bacterium]